MAFNYEYPYTDPNRYNSDWILTAMRELQEEWRNFVPTHDVKFGGIWDGTKTYEAYTIVTDSDLNSYISQVSVPAGIQITDERYWLQIGNYNAQTTQEIEESEQQMRDELNSAVQQIKDETPSIALNLINRKFIFISDSYGVRTISDGRNWIKLLCDLCGIPSSNVTELCRGSSGFTQPDERKWLNMLMNANIANKAEITDIFVGGGANDVAAENEAVLNAISEFMLYVKANFPNATVWISHFGLTFESDNMNRRYLTSLSAYRNSSLYGAKYVYNSEYILCDNTLIESDRVHPNELGIKTLANELTKAIHTGCCDVHYFGKPTIALGGSSSLYSDSAVVIRNGDALIKLDNEAVTILGSGGGSFALISYSTAVATGDSNNNVYPYLFRLSKSYVVGAKDNSKCVDGYARFVSNGNVKVVPCTYYIQNWSEDVYIGLILYNEEVISNITTAQFIIGGNYLAADK